jgi:diguanylate cyclase (GGDEF)-like protein
MTDRRERITRVLGELAQAAAADAGARLYVEDGEGTLQLVASDAIEQSASRLGRLVGRPVRADERGEQGRTLLVRVPDEHGSVIVLARRSEEDFTAEDRAVARLYARQLAEDVAVPSAPPQAAAWSRQLDAIQNVAARLTRLTTLEQVGSAICTETRRVIEYDNARVYVLSPDEPVLEPIAFGSTDHAYDGETHDGLVVNVGEGITGWVAERGIPLLVADANHDPRALPIPGTDPIVEESMLLAPMRHEGAVIGVIVLSRLGLGKFDESDVRLLQIISDQAAIAIDNARLLAGRDRVVQELKSLLDISQATQLAEDEPMLASILAGKLATASGSEACIVSRLDQGSTLLSTLGVHGVRGVAPAYDVFDFPLTRRVLRNGAAELVQADAPDADPAELRLLRSMGAHTLLMLPLTAGGRTIGLVELFWLSAHRRVRPTEMEVLRTMANQAATVLENARLMEQLRQAADIDQVTQVTNHRYLQERLKQECARSARSHSPMSVLMIDLDGFKGINDRHGHADGDRVLRTVALGLKLAVRTHDIVARYGGDEFVVLMPDTDEAQARAVAQRIVSGIRKVRHQLGDGSEETIGASAGLAVYPRDGQTPQRLLLAADAAMYTVKRAGGGGVQRAEPQVVGRPPERTLETLAGR